MRRALLVPLTIGLSSVLSAGCTAAGDRVGELRTAAGELRDGATDTADDTDFCLSLAKATSAIESGSPDTAEEASEEALARAPDEIADDARAVAEAVRTARDSGEWDPDDPALEAAVDRLARTARSTCSP